jgi:hypothetical protein
MDNTNKSPSQTSSSNDDHIDRLFTPDLELESDPQTLRERLLSIDISSISQLIEMEPGDLSFCGISLSDAINLIGSARYCPYLSYFLIKKYKNDFLIFLF